MTAPYATFGGKPQWEEFITPIGLICHLYHDAPQLKFKDQFQKEPSMNKDGIQEAEYKITLAWEKSDPNVIMPLADLAKKVRDTAWPEASKPGAFFALQPFFRDGDNPEHNTKQKDYLLGKYYLNFKQKASAVRDPHNPNVVHYSGAPGLLGPRGAGDTLMPVDIYPGCTGRVSGVMFGTEYMGKHYISTRLNNIQLFETPQTNPNLVRIGGGGRPDAASQFGALVEGGSMAGLTGLGI
jgi:hypothetical protein